MWVRVFQRLRCEAGSRLVQLDNLTDRNRTLTRLFQGAMQSRLLTLVRVCGQRWDEVNAKLENITGQLKVPSYNNYTLNGVGGTVIGKTFYFKLDLKKQSTNEVVVTC